MAREIMDTKTVAAELHCSPRQARTHMKAIGLIDVGHGYVYRDAFDAYLAHRVSVTPYTLPVLQQDYPSKHPRYTRPKRKEA